MGAVVQPVILSGGSGTRLWPLSRESCPKQFVRLQGEHSLIQNTALRAADPARYAKPIVVSSARHRFMIAEQLDEVGIQPAAILLEPVARNTGAAIAVAALVAARTTPDQIIFVMPSDHMILNLDAYHKAVGQARELAAAGRIVTFGIQPDQVETGFGHIKQGALLEGLPGYAVARFVEKPDAETAARYMAEGDYFWNSGMFIARADVMLEAFRTHAPDLLACCESALTAARHDLDFIRLDEEAFSKAPSIAFDRAVMEKTDRAALVPVSMGWSDVGTWHALAQVTESDSNANTLIGPSVAVDARNCYVRSDKLLTTVLGAEDLVVVTTDDAVLVAPRSRTQDVGKLVDQLKAEGRSEARRHNIGYRPWGHYETLTLGNRFQVKRITVKPGASLSLQKHLHRAEHWTVVEGTAQVTVGDNVKLMTENQSVYVPLGEVHRLENPGKVPVTLIEVQTGVYLGEDDIIRLEDTFARVNEKVHD